MTDIKITVSTTKVLPSIAKKGDVMYGYMAWPGAYSFKEEVSLFLEYFKEQIDEVMKKIEQMEDNLE